VGGDGKRKKKKKKKKKKHQPWVLQNGQHLKKTSGRGRKGPITGEEFGFERQARKGRTVRRNKGWADCAREKTIGETVYSTPGDGQPKGSRGGNQRKQTMLCGQGGRTQHSGKLAFKTCRLCPPCPGTPFAARLPPTKASPPLLPCLTVSFPPAFLLLNARPPIAQTLPPLTPQPY